MNSSGYRGAWSSPPPLEGGERWFESSCPDQLAVAQSAEYGSVIPGGPWNSQYTPVDARPDEWLGVGGTIQVKASVFSRGPDHIVRDGKLYLRTQSTRPNLLVVVGVDQVKWNPGLIADYRSEHPELESLWRDPTREDGGVLWLRVWPYVSDD